MLGAELRGRSETPADELMSDDEARYQREEDRAEEQTAVSDHDYVP